MDFEQIEGVREKVKSNFDSVEHILDDMIEFYVGDLQVIVKKVKEETTDVTDVPTSTIENLLCELSIAIISTESNVEKLGLYDGLSKINYKEKYSNTFINDTVGSDGKKRTATEMTAIADNNAMYENVLNDVYNRAYKTAKAVVDDASTLCGILSKILSHKMQGEASASSGDYVKTKQILNEGYGVDSFERKVY